MTNWIERRKIARRFWVPQMAISPERRVQDYDRRPAAQPDRRKGDRRGVSWGLFLRGDERRYMFCNRRGVAPPTHFDGIFSKPNLVLQKSGTLVSGFDLKCENQDMERLYLFAAAALTGIYAGPEGNTVSPEAAAKRAWATADEMMKIR